MAKKKTNTLDQVVELLDEYARLEQRAEKIIEDHISGWVSTAPGVPRTSLRTRRLMRMPKGTRTPKRCGIYGRSWRMSTRYNCQQTPLNVALDYTSTSASTAPFSSQTYHVRISATSPIHYRIISGSGVSSTCTSADPLLPVGVYEIVGVAPGQRPSAIKSPLTGQPNQVSADGRLTIVELC